VARARRALAGDEPEEGEEDELLVSIVAQVGEIVELIPERFHTFTSGKVSPLRRTMKEFEEVRRRHPTSPEQLGHLAMVLVRLDGVEHYETLLGIVKALGEHAVGEVLQRKGWRFPRRTPGLLKLAEEGDFDEKALSLAEEITGKSRDELLEVRHVMQGD
jgi:hypothetical protein